MNAADVLHYRHQTVLTTLAEVPDSEWETGGVCGVWSVKEIVAHLASYEYVLIDVLNMFLAGGPSPHLDVFSRFDGQYNDSEVERRQALSGAEVLDEYQDAHAQVMSLITRIPDEKIRTPGTLPWYGAEYALDDFIVYTFYGHKREHCAQIHVFLDHLKKG